MCLMLLAGKHKYRHMHTFRYFTLRCHIRMCNEEHAIIQSQKSLKIYDFI